MEAHHLSTVVASPEGVDVPSMSALSLEPLTDEQLLHLVSRLSVACDAAPIMNDPMGELVCRLALTALQGSKGGVAQPPVDSAELARREQDIDTLYGELGSLEERYTAAQHKLADMDTHSTANQRKAERLDALLRRIHKTVSRTDYDENAVPGEVEEVVFELEETQVSNGEYRKKLEMGEELQNLYREQITLLEGTETAPPVDRASEIRNARAYEHEIQSARANERSDVFRSLKALEFSSSHRTYTFSKGGKVPCCPSCQGLDPNRVKHTESGHSLGCIVDQMLAAARGT